VLVIPSIAFLFVLDQRSRLHHEGHLAEPAER
jgi:hypothetical protein